MIRVIITYTHPTNGYKLHDIRTFDNRHEAGDHINASLTVGFGIPNDDATQETIIPARCVELIEQEELPETS